MNNNIIQKSTRHHGGVTDRSWKHQKRQAHAKHRQRVKADLREIAKFRLDHIDETCEIRPLRKAELCTDWYAF